MDLIKNLRHMCRICAVNIKKRRSQNSAVSIFDTPQLRDKLKKYLNIDIPSNDELPKCICSICYKKVESIDALAALAKKTENFLLDFIKIAQANLKEAQSTSYQAHFPNEFHSLAMLSNDDDDLNYSSNSNTMVLPVESDITPDLSVTAKAKEQEKKTEEVVLNFTLNDPLTKNIQKKIVVAKQKQSLQNSLQNSNSSNFMSGSHIKLNEEVEISPLKPMQDAGEFMREVNNSLEQKRQNLKMVLNSNNSQPQSSTPHKNTTTETSANYKVIVPPVPSSTPINSHNVNSAGQVQQQQPTMYPQHPDPPPAHVQPVETMQLSKDVIAHAHLASNGNNPAFVKESMNLGSVIKDMDLLKLILKALKWPYNQETLWMQIQRLKNTRFRDVMIDPNLLQDADLMQILSSYLSPILLQQHQAQTSASVSSLPPPPTLSPSAINILPPSVSYKIPAETSVRLVSVPREEQPKQSCIVEPQEIVTLELQQKHDEKREYKQKKLKHRRHHHSVIHQNEQYNLSKDKEPPIIVLSDDDEPANLQNSLNFAKRDSLNACDYAPKVDLSMMQSFDSSTEVIKAINKSLSLYHQSRVLNAEVTIQQRKKQKRKQTLNKIELQKNFNDQEIVIIDEHGEQPFKLSNEVSVVPKSSSSTASAVSITAPIKKSDSIQKPAKFKFDFLLPPKKKRKLQNFETKSTDKSQHSTGISKISNDLNNLPSITENKKDETTLISGNGVSTEKNSAEVKRDDVILQKISNQNEINESRNSTIITENNKEPDISNSESKPHILSVQIIEPVNENSTIVSNEEKKQNKTDEPVKLVNDEQNEVNEDPDDESENGLVIDENYEEKSKDEEPKTENTKGAEIYSKESKSKETLLENKQESQQKEDTEVKLDHKVDFEKLSVIKTTVKEENESDQEGQSASDILKTAKNIKSECVDQQEILPEKEKKGRTSAVVKNNKSNLEKPTVDDKETPRRTTRHKREMPLVTATNKKSKDLKETKSSVSPKETSVGTRTKTRHQEEVKKMQTRNSNISQRGREHKPSAKYSKSTLRKRI
ncbi:uncharacterized protein LOC129618753 [Condylostylus longicornis]|uniref:uncharacterized protein LOC129618753 n=1 Tax=Condylostylus longicornis TaxID=2530218 RepID=UPI00244DFFF6|nr:uncharacterized protein LOC129618753 [Condylostylus longicornis]